MAAESRTEPEQHDPVESLIDDLIHDILSSAGQPSKTMARAPVVALIESALTSRAPAGTSLERILMTQLITSTLADAIAPAIAQILAPEILKALEHYPTGKSEGTGAEKAREEAHKK